MKVVINRCFGGYGLSKEAYRYLGLRWDGFGFAFSEARNDPRLVRCVEALGERANGDNAELAVVDVPDDVKWYISDYDGVEAVHEVHKVWR